MQPPTDILTLDIKQITRKEPWECYWYSSRNLPLEEYARNYNSSEEHIIDQISSESIPIADCVLLTCCRQLVSEETFRNLKNRPCNIINREICPFCNCFMSILYFYVNVASYLGGGKILIGYHPYETVTDLKKRIAIEMREPCINLSTCKLWLIGKRGKGRRLYPEEKEIACFSPHSGLVIRVC